MSFFFLFPDDFVSFAKSLRYTSGFFSNLFFYNDSGYFSQAAELKPLLHTWSLSIEMQYYIILPVLMWGMYKTQLLPRHMLWILLALSIISLLSSEFFISNDYAYSFFMFQNRFWELAAGSCLALILFKQPSFNLKNSNLHSALACLGFLCIAIAIFCFDSQTPFPGIMALLPVIGTTLVIAFARSNKILYKILSLRYAVLIGMMSYSIYLWHHPLLAFARIYKNESLSLGTSLTILSISLLCAALSWKWIETPFRDRKKVSSLKVYVATLICLALTISTAFLIKENKGFAWRFTLPENILNEKNLPPLQKIAPSYLSLKKDILLYGSANASPSRTIALFGDSHAERLLRPLVQYGENRNVTIAFSSLSGCPPILGVDVAKGSFQPGVCEDLSKQQYNFVKENGIKHVLLAGRWGAYTEKEYDGSKEAGFIISKDKPQVSLNNSRELFAEMLKKTLEEYRKLGVHVSIVLQVPQQKRDPKYVYSKNIFFEKDVNRLLENSAVPYAEHIAMQEYNRSIIQKLPFHKVINADSLFCKENEDCTLGTPKFSYYMDDDHLSSYGAELVFNSQIVKALPF